MLITWQSNTLLSAAGPIPERKHYTYTAVVLPSTTNTPWNHLVLRMRNGHWPRGSFSRHKVESKNVLEGMKLADVYQRVCSMRTASRHQHSEHRSSCYRCPILDVADVDHPGYSGLLHSVMLTGCNSSCGVYKQKKPPRVLNHNAEAREHSCHN